MRLALHLIYPFLSLSCLSMELDTPYKSTHPTMQSKKRKLITSNDRQEPINKKNVSQTLPLKKTRLEPLDSDVRIKLLEERGNHLSQEILKTLKDFGFIEEELGNKILTAKLVAQSNNKYGQVSELAGFKVSLFSLNQSAQLLLKNLNANDEETAGNKSLAIIGSRAFAQRLNQFAVSKAKEYVTETYCTKLKEASRAISQITDDVEVRDKFVELKKDEDNLSE